MPQTFDNLPSKTNTSGPITLADYGDDVWSSSKWAPARQPGPLGRVGPCPVRVSCYLIISATAICADAGHPAVKPKKGPKSRVEEKPVT